MTTYKNEYKRTTEHPILSYVLLKVCHNKKSLFVLLFINMDKERFYVNNRFN